MSTLSSWVKRNLLLLAWLQSIAAMLGSLYYSEIKHYTPCVLCWYQRIFMYPLVLILAVAYARKDHFVSKYVLPLASFGWLISLFHNLLYYKIIPEAAAPCQQGVSCTTRFVGYLGFITIPFMAFVAFSVIIVLVYLNSRYNQNTSSEKGI